MRKTWHSGHFNLPVPRCCHFPTFEKCWKFRLQDESHQNSTECLLIVISYFVPSRIVLRMKVIIQQWKHIEVERWSVKLEGNCGNCVTNIAWNSDIFISFNARILLDVTVYCENDKIYYTCFFVLLSKIFPFTIFALIPLLFSLFLISNWEIYISPKIFVVVAAVCDLTYTFKIFPTMLIIQFSELIDILGSGTDKDLSRNENEEEKWKRKRRKNITSFLFNNNNLQGVSLVNPFCYLWGSFIFVTLEGFHFYLLRVAIIRAKVKVHSKYQNIHVINNLYNSIQCCSFAINLRNLSRKKIVTSLNWFCDLINVVLSEQLSKFVLFQRKISWELI